VEEIDLVLERLTELHDTRNFDCGGPTVLSESMRAGYCLRDEKLDRLRTYVAVKATEDARKADGTKDVVGFFSLVAGTMPTDDLPEEARDASYGMPLSLGVIFLDMLARHIAYEGRGVGTFLLLGAIQCAVEASSIVGAAGIFLVAASDRAYRLYKEWSFIDLDGGEYTGYNRML